MPQPFSEVFLKQFHHSDSEIIYPSSHYLVHSFDCVRKWSHYRFSSFQIFTKYFLINNRYWLCNCLLNSSVQCCWYTQRTLFSILFRNIYPSYQFRYISSISNRATITSLFSLNIISQFLYSNSIYTTRTFIGYHLLICSVQIFF